MIKNRKIFNTFWGLIDEKWFASSDDRQICKHRHVQTYFLSDLETNVNSSVTKSFIIIAKNEAKCQWFGFKMWHYYNLIWKSFTYRIPCLKRRGWKVWICLESGSFYSESRYFIPNGGFLKFKFRIYFI